MHDHQSVFGRARESDAVFYDDHCVWIQRQQVELKVQFCAKELMQGQTVGGQVGSIGFICWGGGEELKKILGEQYLFQSKLSPCECFKSDFILGRFPYTQPVAILSSTAQRPSEKMTEGRGVESIGTVNITVVTLPETLPVLLYRHSTRNLPEKIFYWSFHTKQRDSALTV